MRVMLLVAAAAALIATDAASAQTAAFFDGATETGYCGPFSCYGPFNQFTGYQQVFSSSVFTGGPSLITTIHFYPGSFGGYVDTGTYDFYFSTTSAPVNGLSTDLASNVTGPSALFGHFVLDGGPATSWLDFTGSQPYLYDPSAGNLLMTIAISNWHGGGTGTYQASFVSTCSRAENAQYNGAEDNIADGGCLNTAIDYTLGASLPTTTTPEPSSMALVGTGLVGLVPMVRRKRRR